MFCPDTTISFPFILKEVCEMLDGYSLNELQTLYDQAAFTKDERLQLVDYLELRITKEIG